MSRAFEVVDAEGSERNWEELDVSFEKVMLASERKTTKRQKVLLMLLGGFGYMPKMSFDLEDVDRKRVDKMMRHTKHLKTIADWINVPSQELLPALLEAKRALEPLQKKVNYGKIFRGFSPKNADQEHMGLSRAGWFGPKPSDFRVGDKFSYVGKRALSFTHFENVAPTFGNVIVSIDYQKNKHRLFSIDYDILTAVELMDDPDLYASKTDESNRWKLKHFMTYGELIYLPDGKPLEYRVESRPGSKKTKE